MPDSIESGGKILTLKEHAYRVIRERLEGGGVRAGSRLSDNALAKEFGISRGPVREAINQLASEGLIESRPRRGAFVRKLSRRELDELYEVRAALESFAASKAAMVATDKQLAELQRLHQKVLETVKDCRSMPNQIADEKLTTRFLASDMQFHIQIIDSVGNQKLTEMVKSCKILIRVFTHTHVEHDLRLMVDSAEQHASIIDAIRRHDSSAARDLMMSHILTAGKYISEHE
jgi:DNA-binding GntR family transcriptional regulator